MGPAELCINVSRQTWAFILPPKENFHTLFRLFTALSFYENHVKTTNTLGQDKSWNVRGLLIRILNILLFVEIDVKVNHGNSCLWPITALLIGDPMVCGYLTSQMILTLLCVIKLLK